MAALKQILGFKPKPHKTQEGRIALVLNHHNIDLFFDIGGNIGQTGQHLREWDYNNRIVSFEPVSSAYTQLSAAAQNDPLWDIAPQMALGNETGETQIHVSQAVDMSSLQNPTNELLTALPRTAEEKTITVPIKKFDDVYEEYLGGAQKPFLKIDVQGHEMNVLQGAEKALEKCHGIAIEMSLFPLYENETLFLDICQFLDARGFKPHLMLERTFSRKLCRQLQVDGIFFRE